MNIRTLLPAAAILSAAFLPGAALADLQVNANGFDRVIASSTQGDSCEVERLSGVLTVTCPNGSRGTLLLYRQSDETPVCQVDFWYGGNGSGAQTWRAQLAHTNAASGTCTLHWNNATTLNLSG